jgi:hypothetical protein
MNANGYVIHEGASLFDGAPIVVIATGFASGSANVKTGAMIQTWILRADMDPLEATKFGADDSVCGDCKHRPANLGTCYVKVFQAPLGIWRAYKRGSYPRAHDVAALFAGRMVRIGAYGDPAAAPVELWRAVISQALGFTGYSHQWSRAESQPYAQFCMASVDTAAELDAARALGWRTFRVKTVAEPIAVRESACPAAAESGAKVTCAQCRACNGTATGRRGSIAINVHGAMSRKFTRSMATSIAA